MLNVRNLFCVISDWLAKVHLVSARPPTPHWWCQPSELAPLRLDESSQRAHAETSVAQQETLEGIPGRHRAKTGAKRELN